MPDIFKLLSNRLKDYAKKLYINTIEKSHNTFYTFHERPRTARNFDRKSIDISASYAIVIQGPLAHEFDFTIETIKIYKQIFPKGIIIVSTWEGEDEKTLNLCTSMGCTVVTNKKPSYAGWGNINLQIVSSRAGMEKARERGVLYVFKTRTDQRVYSTDIFPYFLSLQETFPSMSPQKQRIIGASFNTFKYRPYSVSDTFLFGTIDDMLLFWSAPLDNRPPQKIEETTISWMMSRQAEVYLVTNYVEKLGHTVTMTLSDTWDIYAKYFCIVDQKSIDLFFLKYSRELEWRRIHYNGDYLDEELFFKDWLLMYKNYLNGTQASKVPLTINFPHKFS